MRLAVLLLLLACNSERSTPVRSLLTVAASGCYNPVDYGAIPSDGLSDRIAFQAALDAAAAMPDGGTLCIAAGRWTMERAPIGSYNRFATLSTHAHDVTIAGVGPETVLELVGDQGLGDTTVISIDPSAARIVVRDLTIDTSAASNTSEQTHAIATSGTCSAAGGTCLPITDLEIRDVTFRHPKVGIERKGDCIRLLGNADATRVDRVQVAGSSFVGCARSAITIQRNVHAWIVTGNTFYDTGDTDIDSEPTGGTGDTNDTGVVSGNVFVGGAAAQGDYAITLGGIGAPMASVAVTGNVFQGRGVKLYRTATTTITGNTILSKMVGLGGVVEVSNVCSGLVVSGNTMSRTGAPGPMVRLSPHSGGLCSRVVVAHNAMTQDTVGHGIYMESVSDANIEGNALTWTVGAPQFSAIYARAIAPVDRVTIAGNRINGSVTYGVTLHAAPAAFGVGIRVVGNAADGTTTGLRCTGSGAFGGITSYGNTLGPRACPGVTFGGGD